MSAEVRQSTILDEPSEFLSTTLQLFKLCIEEILGKDLVVSIELSPDRGILICLT